MLGLSLSRHHALSLRLYSHRGDRQTESLCLFLFHFDLFVSLFFLRVKLGNILAQSRIAVPRINGETPGMNRAALRSKRQNMTGYGEEALFTIAWCPLYSGTPAAESLRSTQKQPYWSSQGGS